MSSYTPISTRGGHWSRYLRQVCSKKTPAHPHGIVCGGRRGRNPAHPGTVRECLGRIENCVHMAETTRSLLGACPTQWMTEQKEERNVMIDSTSHECLRLYGKLGASIARAFAFAVASEAAITGGTANAAATLDHASYGTAQGGQAVDIFTMTNDHGLRVRFLSLGGVITEIDVPDRAGRLDNIVLGLKTVQEYETLPGHYGAITGRYANRIGGAQFTLGDQTYHLIANNGQHAPWRPQRARSSGLDGIPHTRAGRCRRNAELCQQGWRSELPRDLDHPCNLHTDQRQRAADRLSGKYRQGYGDQLHQPFLFQLGRQRLRFGRRPAAVGQCRPLHAHRARSDPHR